MTIKVVIFSSGHDTGGQGWRIKRAFGRYQPDFSVRSLHTDDGYFHFPSDIRYDPLSAYDLFGQADVLHLRNTLGGSKRLTNGVPKPTILHHHGSRFREYHATIYPEAKAAGAIQIVSTLDLTLLEPELIWLPAPFDAEELRAIADKARAVLSSTVRIAHAPTNREVKSTRHVISAIGSLYRAGYKVELDLIERRPYAECLARKAKADILVDQLHLGYGNNAAEAWGMGIPVVAGVSDPRARARMVGVWGSLPFFEANEANLEDRLIELVTNSGLRAHWAEVGWAHLTKWHNEVDVAGRLANIYRSALGANQIERAS